jgi:LPXTG-motif cell wall-anchored protein
MASKGPIIAAGALTGAFFFWRKKRKKQEQAEQPGGTGEVAADEVTADA